MWSQASNYQNSSSYTLLLYGGICVSCVGRSTHVSKLHSALNKACRFITRCPRQTSADNVYLLACIAPPGVRRATIARQERRKQTEDSRHSLYSHEAVMNNTTCSSAPLPSKLLMSHLSTNIDNTMHINNPCLSTSVFLSSCKFIFFCLNLLKTLFLPASSNTLLITILLINFSLHIGVVTLRKLLCYVFITILLQCLERATGDI